ncbi:hypothetical protein ABTO68_20280, partial [Acinetobacter baumannii]
CLAMPLYLLLERLAWRWLDCAWHPGLLRFFLSFIVLSVLVLKFCAEVPMSIVRLSKVAATVACGLLALCLALQLWQAYVL